MSETPDDKREAPALEDADVLLLMLEAADRHTAQRGRVDLGTLIQAMSQASVVARGFVAPLSAAEQPRVIEHTVAVLKHSGHVVQFRDGCQITQTGRVAASQVSVAGTDRSILARCVIAALARQAPPLSRMQRAVRDMRRGRPPRWC